MGKKTPLYACHLSANAKMVDFAGWEMPLHYGSQVKEHHIVRQSAGVFDVSHMTIVDCEGEEAAAFLRFLLANNIDRLTPYKALYTCMLNEKGGVIDDLIVYKINDDMYRLVVNSATHDKDMAWLEKVAKNFKVTITERPELAMLAIQGPCVIEKLKYLFNNTEAAILTSLQSFQAVQLNDYFIARTGYTGEDGFEIILSADKAVQLWEKIIAAGILPCGLGARDTLRLEAGLNLYGVDMDETVTPLESNLAWTVAFTPARDFMGREALQKQKESGVEYRLVGLILEGQGVLRNHQKVIVPDIGLGEITSGSFSPTLNKGIALARVPKAAGAMCFVEIRDKEVLARVVKPPFIVKKNIVAIV